MTIKVDGLGKYDCEFKTEGVTRCSDSAKWTACPKGESCVCREDCSGRWGPSGNNNDDAYCSGGGPRVLTDMISKDDTGFALIDRYSDYFAVTQSGDSITVSSREIWSGSLVWWSYDLQIACPPRADSNIKASCHTVRHSSELPERSERWLGL